MNTVDVTRIAHGTAGTIAGGAAAESHISTVAVDERASVHNDGPATAGITVGIEDHIDLVVRGGDAYRRIDHDIVVGLERQCCISTRRFCDCRTDRNVAGIYDSRPRCIDDHVGPSIQGGDDGRCGDSGRGVCRASIGQGIGSRYRVAVVSRAYVDVVGIEQPSATFAERSTGIGRVRDFKVALAGCLDKTAIAAKCTAPRGNVAVGTCRVIGPDDQLAAVAVARGIGLEAGLGAEVADAGVLYR